MIATHPIHKRRIAWLPYGRINEMDRGNDDNERRKQTLETQKKSPTHDFNLFANTSAHESTRSGKNRRDWIDESETIQELDRNRGRGYRPRPKRLMADRI